MIVKTFNKINLGVHQQLYSSTLIALFHQTKAMKKITTQTFIEQLETDTRQVMVALKRLQQQDPELLLQQPAPAKWSVAQVIEHLNTYGRYYLPKIREELCHNNFPASTYFSPGILGAYFTKSMKPKPDGKIANKMKAFKNHSPEPNVDSKTALDEFDQQELLLLQLLNKGRDTDLSKIRIPISIAPFIRLKLGDVFAFIVAHHQRHFVQINDTLAAIKSRAYSDV
jgi:hypothetical protein